jgi:hypothetical protein
MKKVIIIILTVSIVCQLTDYYLNSRSKENDLLITNYQYTNSHCRGEDPNLKSTWDACDQRNIIAEKLYKRGFCYGHGDQAEYQKSWQLCK